MARPKLESALAFAEPKLTNGEPDDKSAIVKKSEFPFPKFKMSKLAFRTTFEPRLYYLQILISNATNFYSVRALIDTGCAKSAMSNNCFQALKRISPKLKIAESNAKIQTCDGTNHNIVGFVTINISFPNATFRLVEQQVMVVEQLSDDFIIGSDILGSRCVLKIQPPNVVFTDGKTEFPQRMLQVNYPNLSMKTISQVTLEPLEYLKVTTELTGFKSLVNPVRASSCCEGLQISNLSIDNDEVVTTMTNVSGAPITVPENKQLLRICKSSFHQSLPNDEYMNEIEKIAAFNAFRDDGVYQPSVTAFIESRSQITDAEKIEIPSHVSEEEFIAMFDLNHFHKLDRQKLVDILLKTREAFSMHKYDIGRTSVVTMDVELIKEEEDKVQKYFPISMHVIDKANEILDQMEKYGIIRECHVPTPYCSNILVIPKKDNNSVRLLFDGRLLNYNTKRMPVAIITKAEILAHLVNKTHLTSLDFADAFFHIPLTEKAQNLTAFWTPNHAKKMCFNRAPQGLKNSPMYLKMVLDHVFYDLSKNVLFYADDLLIATNGTLDEHFEFLELVLKRLIKAGLKLRPQKLLIARETIDFLGMVFYRNTLSIPDLKLKAFKDLPIPNTARKLKSALCAFSYYRHFVPDFAHITRELHEKSSDKTKRKFVMSEEETQKFKSIIDTICKNAKTYYPDNSKPFYVQTDASEFCAGGRLFQKDETGNEMLIAAVSRTFTKTERNYAIYKKEGLALIYTLRAMDFFLKFAPKLILLVDSKALTYIRLAKDGSAILLRFSLELSKYEADLIHIPGAQNEISDMLSRQHKDIPQMELEKKDRPSISEKDTVKIIDALTMPDNFTMTRTQLFSLLNGPSPVDDSKKRKTVRSKAQPGLKQVKNTPLTLNNRKIKMPRTVQINALTRAMRKKVQFADDNIVQEFSNLDPPTVIILAEPTTEGDRDVSTSEREPIILRRGRSRGREVRSSSDPMIETRAEDRVEIPSIENTPQLTDDIIVDENNSVQYSDISSQLQVLNNDQISKKQFRTFQMMDPTIKRALENKQADVIIVDGLVHKAIGSQNKLMLPESLVPALVNLHHFTTPGLHKTTSQIVRDILSIYSIPMTRLRQLIVKQISHCHICQMFDSGKQNLHILQLPRFKIARLSWSVDLITDLPCSDNGFKILLVAVDDFSNFLLAIPLVSTTSEDLIKAIRHNLIGPFGVPKFIRSDEQPGIYNSREFFAFFKELGIELQATAVASPFSNGRAETTIKIFKHSARKYFFQHKCIGKWDEHVPILAASINSSINSYGFAPEEIMFGHRLENRYALIDLPQEAEESTNERTIELLLETSAKIREKYDKAKVAKHMQNATFKNMHAPRNKFEIGDLVLHRQLQVSTGTASKYKPLLTGPYVIQAVDKVTATCRNLQSSRVMKAHFHNLVHYNYDESTLYPPANMVEGPQLTEA